MEQQTETEAEQELTPEQWLKIKKKALEIVIELQEDFDCGEILGVAFFMEKWALETLKKHEGAQAVLDYLHGKKEFIKITLDI